MLLLQLLQANHTMLIHILRAEAYTKNGHFKEAINDYGRLITLDPSNPWPYLYRGKILANLNRGH